MIVNKLHANRGEKSNFIQWEFAAMANEFRCIVAVRKDSPKKLRQIGQDRLDYIQPKAVLPFEVFFKPKSGRDISKATPRLANSFC